MTDLADPPALPRGLSRRQLLGRLGGLTLAGLAAPALSTRLAFADSTAPAGDVVVVLSLRGGFDGLSAVAPVGDPAYATLRPTIGVPADRGLTLDRTFAFHPAMAPLMPLWQAGRLAAVHAVTPANHSRSHFNCLEEMERAAPGTSLRPGWLNRLLAVRSSGSTFAGTEVGSPTAPISLTGPRQPLALGTLKGYTLHPPAGLKPDQYAAAMRTLWDTDHSLTGAAAQATLDSVATAWQLTNLANRPAVTPGYADDPLARALRDVATLVKAKVGLEAAAVDYGDWDMHSGLGAHGDGRFATHIVPLAAALAAFAADLGPDLSRVTLVTLSEFGRRAAENGTGGVDHGYGNAVLLLSGGLRGSAVYGRWPGLGPGALDDGDVAGTTDYRDILNEILVQRCNVGSTASIFPGFTPTPVGFARRG